MMKKYSHKLQNGAFIYQRQKFAWIPTKVHSLYLGNIKIVWMCFYWSHTAKSNYGMMEFAKTKQFLYLNPPTKYYN